VSTEEERARAAARQRIWRANNRERSLEIQRRWRENNHEKAIEKTRRWKETNREHLRAYGLAWFHQHPGKSVEYCERRRARQESSGEKITAEEWQSVLRQFDGKCACCGSCNDVSMDHVIPLSKGGRHAIENIQPLCRSCNSKKRTKEVDYRDKWKPAGETITVEGTASPI